MGDEMMGRDERRRAVEALHAGITEQCGNEEELLWQVVVAYEDYLFHTSSGLPFSYTVKTKKDGTYSGELLISRKEGSKTLTKSSVFLAFQKVLERMRTGEGPGKPEYKGPKAIGQIFGISYVYSLFWEFGLIEVPEKVAGRLSGREE